MRVAIQGETGSFSDEAARTFLPGCSVVPCVTSSDVFDRLDSGGAAAALVPIENSLAGPVAQHLDLLLARDAFIQREFRLRIRHNLIAAPGVKLKDIRRVFSHPIALEQCRDFFRRHRQARAESFYDTAGSVRHVVGENLRDAAAIAGSRAAAVYKGRILLRGLEDDKQNFTRFFLVSRSRRVHRAANKTSIAFALKNAPGALFKALSVFALRDIDLSKIESRPFRGRPFEYVFFIDYLRGDDAAARKGLGHLAEIAEFVKVLGIYPAA
jgi:prephenate dehydratase